MKTTYVEERARLLYNDMANSKTYSDFDITRYLVLPETTTDLAFALKMYSIKQEYPQKALQAYKEDKETIERVKKYKSNICEYCEGSSIEFNQREENGKVVYVKFSCFYCSGMGLKRQSIFHRFVSSLGL